MPNLTAGQRTYQIEKLVERRILQPIKEGMRQYALGFSNRIHLRDIVRALLEEGFVPSIYDRAE